ncbi:MAG TPA: hypothetical protein VK466_05960 [Terriglobales bacterium]|nr:hypothetical protein [Terriglobales bacterium]
MPQFFVAAALDVLGKGLHGEFLARATLQPVENIGQCDHRMATVESFVEQRIDEQFLDGPTIWRGLRHSNSEGTQ